MPGHHRFDAERCDLCGSGEYTLLVDGPSERAMRSDGLTVAQRLRKYSCTTCGLVRSGGEVAGDVLGDCYADQYAAALPGEHAFFGPEGPVPRSAVFADWFLSASPAWSRARRILEIGAGAGRQMEELSRRLPEAHFEGIEPSRAAVEQGRARGLHLAQSTVEGLTEGDYDLVYSVAVLEHVASPTRFLSRVRARLRDGGRLVLTQPTQDVPSYDVFFVDHLHHFGSGHLRAYAVKCGFEEEEAQVGYRFMPNFSLHVWRAVPVPAASPWHGAPISTTCAATVARVRSDFERLDALLDDLRRRERRVAVFGLAEVYALARAYSHLGEFPLVCGLVDGPPPSREILGLPVVPPEECRALGVQDVILTMNKIYYEAVTARLSHLGLHAHPLLS